MNNRDEQEDGSKKRTAEEIAKTREEYKNAAEEDIKSNDVPKSWIEMTAGEQKEYLAMSVDERNKFKDEQEKRSMEEVEPMPLPASFDDLPEAERIEELMKIFLLQQQEIKDLHDPDIDEEYKKKFMKGVQACNEIIEASRARYNESTPTAELLKAMFNLRDGRVPMSKLEPEIEANLKDDKKKKKMLLELNTAFKKQKEARETKEMEEDKFDKAQWKRKIDAEGEVYWNSAEGKKMQQNRAASLERRAANNEENNA